MTPTSMIQPREVHYHHYDYRNMSTTTTTTKIGTQHNVTNQGTESPSLHQKIDNLTEKVSDLHTMATATKAYPPSGERVKSTDENLPRDLEYSPPHDLEYSPLRRRLLDVPAR